MKTETLIIDPRKIKLLEVNARFMRHETFMRLVDNVKSDGVLTQIPFCALWKVYQEGDEIQMDKDGDPIFEVLSGNHRVKAAIAANLPEIEVQVTRDPLSLDRRKAIQLSHNEISGEDDPDTLKRIYGGIKGVDWKLYSGLDDKKLELLDSVQPGSLAEANLRFQPISMLFLPNERDELDNLWDQVKDLVAGSKSVWLTRWKEYDAVLDALEAASTSYGVRNTATAMMLVLEVFSRHITDLTEGWLDEQGEARKGRSKVPLASVFGSVLVDAKDGAVIQKAVAKMIGRGEIGTDDMPRALALWAKAYLGQK